MKYKNINIESKQKQGLYYVLGFLLSPFLSILFFIKNFYRVPNPKTMIVLFSAFIGFAYYIAPGKDINRYIDDFKSYDKNFSEFLIDLVSRYDTKGGRLDFYIDAVSLILRTFTDNVEIFLITLGVIFGIFYSNYLVTILKKIKRIDLITGIFIFIFVIELNPQIGINSRFYTASACSLLGFYSFYLNGNKKSLLLIMLSIFIHLGTGGFIVMYLLIFLLRNRPLAAMIIAVITLGVSSIDFSAFAKYFSLIGDGVEHKLEGYANERFQERYEIRFGNEAVWFLKLRARSFFLAAFVLLSYFYMVKLKYLDIRTKQLFVAAALATSYWNLINSFPMVYRYEPLLVTLVSSFFVHLNGNYILTKRQKNIQLLLIPFMALFAFISFRNFLSAIPIHFFLSNPIIEGFMESSADVYSFFFS